MHKKNILDSIEKYVEEVKDLYTNDSIPWIIGYSGGKDSTAVLQLVWRSISELPPEKRTKQIHVITTDTLVENPVVSEWVNTSLEKMDYAATEQSIPITTHLLEPNINDSFWVNLIGRGYPAPRNNFRWCTDRLKIKPSNTFIKQLVKLHGEAILLLGMRKAESSARANVMNKYEQKQVRNKLNLSATLANCLIYAPLSDWTNDDVWLYLLQYANPWGHENKDLLSMYSGATADGECPVVVDTSTPSCGSSRFGCWVCTLVEQDKSMSAMIKNDVEKEWMAPLLKFRNRLDFRTQEDRARDRSMRDYRRMSGVVETTRNGDPVPGPYIQQARAILLRELLEIQNILQDLAPDDMKHIELISVRELEKIRDIWMKEKNEIEDLVPLIYEEVFKTSYPGATEKNKATFTKEDLELLRDISGDNETYELVRNLISIEHQYSNKLRRSGIYNELKSALKKYSVKDREEAIGIAKRISDRKEVLNSFKELNDLTLFNQSEE